MASFNLAADADGGPVLVGDFSGTVTLSQNTSIQVSSASPDSAFVVRYDPGGAYTWKETLDCGQDSASGSACWFDGVAADTSGNIFVIGTFEGSLSLFGSTPLVAPPSLFVAKVSSAPALIWAKSYDGSGVRNGGLGSLYLENVEYAGLAVTPQGAPVVFAATSGPIDVGWGSLTPAAGVQTYAFVTELAP